VHRLHRIIRMAIAVCCIAFAHAKDNPNPARDYKKALKQIESGDLKVDFKALRLNCVIGGYSCEADAEIKNKIKALLKENKHDEALKEINKALKEVFVDIDLHYYSYVANTKLKKNDQADFHKAIREGLLNSIQERRHGRSIKDAFLVLNANEEEEFLKFKGMQVWQKRLLNEGGHFYDEIYCTDATAEDPLILYFNMDIPLSSVLDFFSKKK
jgi:hypothetical protein